VAVTHQRTTKEIKELKEQQERTNIVSTLLPYKNEERKMLAECLFYIYYQTVIPGACAFASQSAEGDEAVEVLRLLFACTTLKTGARAATMDLQIYDPPTLQVCRYESGAQATRCAPPSCSV
jgi:hypothetical protein